jgi:hypothetical protein
VVAGDRQVDIIEGLRNAGSTSDAVDLDENTIRFVVDFLQKESISIAYEFSKFANQHFPFVGSWTYRQDA